MRVFSLRRYPVKSMGGETLDAAEVDARGLAGDRWYAVKDDNGRLASGKDTHRFRRRDQIFDYWARTTHEDVVVTGRSGQWKVGDPALDAELTRSLGASVRVTPETAVPHQDMGPVSLVSTATLSWCHEHWGANADPRRLRVNIVVEADEPFIEESWAGRRIAVGDVDFTVGRRIARCRTIDIDQDGARARGRWLKPLAQERDMCLAMYADVATPGVVRVGDALSLP